MEKTHEAPQELLYFNRELSWLRFNRRVLEESACEETPLYERLRFVSIFASNLDEFYMVRVGTLLDQSSTAGVRDNKTQMTPAEQIRAVNQAARELYPLRDRAYWQIMEKLSESAVYHARFRSLDGGERRLVSTMLRFDILPVLSPQIIDLKHPFPHLESLQMYIGVRFKSKDNRLFGVIPLPRELDRILLLPGGGKFLLLEDVLLHYASTIFSAYTVEAKAVFRVTRNADIRLSPQAMYEETNYRELMDEMLQKRRRLAPVRLEVSDDGDDALLRFFLHLLGLSRSHCFLCRAPLDLSFVAEMEKYIPAGKRGEVEYTPLRPQWPAGLPHAHIAEQLRYGDLLLAYPYDSMRPLIELIREAAEDREVVSIRMTLYRISDHSQIVQHLCTAAENGKSVTVVIELRARFDEKNNINWSKILEESGCQVIYGLGDLKVHAKVLLITRRAHSRPGAVLNIATGNYNENTARFYSDLSLLTADPELCEDAAQFFRDVTMGSMTGRYRRLLVAPETLKEGILAQIDGQKRLAEQGGRGSIFAKMNSLTDKDVIDALVSASRSGVEVELIVRGICCLRPGVPGYSEHIRVRSIVGRFLEHARIYRFGEGEDAAWYIGSADMMTRNTENRVEVLAPVLDKKIKARLAEIVALQLKDNVKARLLSGDGRAVMLPREEGPVDSQIVLYRRAYRDAASPEQAPAGRLGRVAGLFARTVRRLRALVRFPRG